MKHILHFLVVLFLLSNPPSLLAAKAQKAASPAVKNSDQTQQELKNEGSSQVNKPNENGESEMIQNRVKACQDREAGIKTRSQNMTQFSFKLMETLGTMANRVEDYYQKQLMSQGIKVSNYQKLSAEVKTKKASALAISTQAQNSLLGFNCNSENPSQALNAFNGDMTKLKTALKEYKGAVKNLGEAVKTAAKKGN